MFSRKQNTLKRKIDEYLLYYSLAPLYNLLWVYHKLFLMNSVWLGAFYTPESYIYQIDYHGTIITKKMTDVVKSRKRQVEARLLRAQLEQYLNIKEGALLQCKKDIQVLDLKYKHPDLKWRIATKGTAVLLLSIDNQKEFDVTGIKVLAENEIYFIPLSPKLHFKYYNYAFKKKFNIIRNKD